MAVLALVQVFLQYLRGVTSNINGLMEIEKQCLHLLIQ